MLCTVQSESERDRDVLCAVQRLRETEMCAMQSESESERERDMCVVQGETKRDKDACCVLYRVRLRGTEMCVVCSAA